MRVADGAAAVEGARFGGSGEALTLGLRSGDLLGEASSRGGLMRTDAWDAERRAGGSGDFLFSISFSGSASGSDSE